MLAFLVFFTYLFACALALYALAVPALFAVYRFSGGRRSFPAWWRVWIFKR